MIIYFNIDVLIFLKEKYKELDLHKLAWGTYGTKTSKRGGDQRQRR